MTCLEDGLNTVTGGKSGNATVYVGQKGDNVAFTGQMNANQFKYISSSINVALNPTNGAESWVKNGPAGSRNASLIGSAGERGKGCAGDGPLQCYSVTSRRINETDQRRVL